MKLPAELGYAPFVAVHPEADIKQSKVVLFNQALSSSANGDGAFVFEFYAQKSRHRYAGTCGWRDYLESAGEKNRDCWLKLQQSTIKKEDARIVVSNSLEQHLSFFNCCWIDAGTVCSQL